MTTLKKITKKSCFSRLNGQRVVKRVEGIRTIEDIDAIRDTLIQQLKAQGAPLEAMSEDDQGFHFSNGQFVLKPKMHREEVGILNVRSKDYVFVNDEKRAVSGDTAQGDTEYRETGFTRRYPNGMTIHFDLAH